MSLLGCGACQEEGQTSVVGAGPCCFPYSVCSFCPGAAIANQPLHGHRATRPCLACEPPEATLFCRHHSRAWNPLERFEPALLAFPSGAPKPCLPPAPLPTRPTPPLRPPGPARHVATPRGPGSVGSGFFPGLALIPSLGLRHTAAHTEASGTRSSPGGCSWVGAGTRRKERAEGVSRTLTAQHTLVPRGPCRPPSSGRGHTGIGNSTVTSQREGGSCVPGLAVTRPATPHPPPPAESAETGSHRPGA